jgi:glycosyltransferase involved in cell wall biosynthesis
MLDPWNMTKGAIKKRLYLALRARTNLNRAAAIHFTTKIEHDWVARLKLRAPAIVEPLGVNFAEFENLPPAGTFRNAHNLSGRPMVLFLGRIHRGKGVELLLPALAQMKRRDAILIIAGPDGNFRSEADALIAQHNLKDRVIFTGLVTGPQRLAVLADADVLALPSWHENFGLVVIEALAARTPVVVSDQVGLHPEITAAGVGGVVPLDAGALAAELDRWLDDDAGRNAAGEKGRELVRSRFDWDSIARRWAGHYADIVESGARRAALAPAAS